MITDSNSNTESPKILIIDDERFNINALHGLLRGNYRTMVATNGELGLKAARTGGPDLILLDINMPGMNGFDVCRRLKENPATQRIPVIFITAMNEAANETYGLDIGAVDYITKPFNPAVVKARVRTHLRLKMQADLLERFAFRDALTGLANRRAFDDRIEQEWNRCLRNQRPLSVILLDVDHFKLYNDHYGHGAGDECLSSVARELASTVNRSSDLVARYGGEEFVVILPETDASQAAKLAEALRASVDNLALPHTTSPVTDHVTVSLGVAVLIPSVSTSPDTLLKVADQMLYQAKDAGRNRFQLMDFGMD